MIFIDGSREETVDRMSQKDGEIVTELPVLITLCVYVFFLLSK